MSHFSALNTHTCKFQCFRLILFAQQQKTAGREIAAQIYILVTWWFAKEDLVFIMHVSVLNIINGTIRPT